MKNEKKNFINLDGERILVKYERMDILKLKFYPDNPRILSIINQNPKIRKSEELIRKELWGKNETHRLCKSIEKHGGLIHPLIVHDGHVLEGNTRLCCFRHLYERNKDKIWRFIDCEILLVKTLPKQKIDALLGNEHIMGKIEWDTYEKGCWMTKMLREDNYSLDKIGDIVEHPKKWVNNHIWAYETMLQNKIPEKEKFSHFVQIISNAEIQGLKKKDPKIITKIIKLVKNNQVSIAQDIRKIPKLWNDKKSLKKLENDEKVDQVFSELKARDITLTSPFLQEAQEIAKKIENLTVIKREEIGKDNKGRFVIKKLANASIKLCRELGVKI